MTTDTPRTDAFGNNLVKCYCPRCIVGVHDNLQLAAQYRKHAEWKERAEKAEAEVERLKEERNRIGVEIRGEYIPKLKKLKAEVERLKGEVMKAARMLATIVDALEQAVPWIKTTLNPTNK